MTFHLAQVNIGRVRGPMDSEIMHGFASRLAEINALADNAHGFVWRLQSDDGDATSIHVYDDEMLLINMSVWESIEALFEYTYKSDHTQLLRGRAEWFERLESHGHRRRRGNRPEIGRAVQNLMAAMRNRVMREGWNESLLDDVTEILDDAAKRIERLK